MNQEATKQSYRGVRCLSCRQPIPLPQILFKMDSNFSESDAGSVHDHPTRVFSLRCRACEREKPYRASDIMDFEGAPRTRVASSRILRPAGRHSGEKSRAANG